MEKTSLAQRIVRSIQEVENKGEYTLDINHANTLFWKDLNISWVWYDYAFREDEPVQIIGTNHDNAEIKLNMDLENLERFLVSSV